MFFSRTRCQPESESEVSGEEDGEEAEDTGEVAADEPGEDVGEGAGGGDGRQPHDGLAKATTKLKPPRTCLELNGSSTVRILSASLRPFVKMILAFKNMIGRHFLPLYFVNKTHAFWIQCD